MRIFSSARVAVIDADPDHRTMLCAALADFGMVQLVPVAGLSEARELARQTPFDLVVVNAPGFAAAAAGGLALPLNPFDPARTPAILLAADTGRETVRVAAAHGYRVVLPSPAVPRIVYRRIGSILQKVRRANRVKAPQLAPRTPARVPELQS